MSTNEPSSEERLAALLALLPPAPEGWMQAAIELPAARAQLDTIIARAQQDANYRAHVLADLENALAADGITATPAVRRELERRLTRDT
jgi:hypothetical protein